MANIIHATTVLSIHKSLDRICTSFAFGPVLGDNTGHVFILRPSPSQGQAQSPTDRRRKPTVQNSRLPEARIHSPTDVIPPAHSASAGHRRLPLTGGLKCDPGQATCHCEALTVPSTQGSSELPSCFPDSPRSSRRVASE